MLAAPPSHAIPFEAPMVFMEPLPYAPIRLPPMGPEYPTGAAAIGAPIPNKT
ncbi:hypothetical protein AVEN_11611-1, partial [Araneus ventricosus]